MQMSRSPNSKNLLYLAQSSVKMASAACSKSSGSKAAMAMVWGKTVTVPVRATSWETSFHQ